MRIDTRKYELFVRFSQDGSFKGAQMQEQLIMVNEDGSEDFIRLTEAREASQSEIETVFSAHSANVMAQAAAAKADADAMRAANESLQTQLAAVKAELEALKASPPVQESSDLVHLWQVRAALDSAGVLEAANAAIANSGNAALIAFWEYGNTIDPKAPIVASLAATIGLSAEQVAALVAAARAIAI